ncbi:MAG: DNA-binding protein [Rhodospirillales bacterium]|nr:DNA-binding protein [Rhodospirillales bacterium]
MFKTNLARQDEPVIDGLADRILAPIPTAARALGIGRTRMYQIIDAGNVESVKLGKRHLVVVESLHAYADRLRAKA